MTLSPAALAAARAMTEDDLLAAVLGTPKRPGLARVYGWLGHHETDSRKTAPGWLDLTLLRAGRLVVAELKTETGRTTPAQEEWLAAWREAEDLARARTPELELRPVTVYVWRPSDLIAGRIADVLR